MLIDFHCHISGEGGRLPEPDGQYYRQINPNAAAGQFLGHLAQDAVDTVSELWRTPAALKTYRNMGPLIYTEMSRRLINADSAALLAEMAQNGIGQSVVVAIDPFITTDSILRACQQLSGLLVPFGSIDPSEDEYLANFESLLDRPIKGIKFHSDLQRMPIGSPKLFNLMKILANSSRSDLPVYLHTGNFPIYQPSDEHWERTLPRLLDQFPGLTFVCGHAGWDAPHAALRAALRFDNVMLETSWQPPQLIRRLCDKLGAHRLLLGSDYPLYSQKRAVRNLRTALNPDEFEMVGGQNAQKLLNLDGTSVPNPVANKMDAP